MDRHRVPADAQRWIEFLMEENQDESGKERLLADPRRFFDKEGVFIPEGMDIQVHQNTRDTFHLVFPPDPNAMLQDEALLAIAGGKTASTSGTAGSATTASTLAITASSASSASTIGCLGCAS